MSKQVSSILLVVLLSLNPFSVSAQTCSRPFQSMTQPLSDRNSPYKYYLNFGDPTSVSIIEQPGLFKDGLNQAPSDHINHGITAAQNIYPLNINGLPDPSGKIGVISIGMSNTRMVFGPFMSAANNLSIINPHVAFANTAMASMVADNWNDPSDTPWMTLGDRLGEIDRKQVQVIWVKMAMMGPQNYPDPVEYLHQRLSEIVLTAKNQLPNLKIAFISSRTRSYDINTFGTQQHGLNSEPYAFLGAFSARRLIEEQINNPVTGRLNLISSPYLTWGPYLWIDGQLPRSDGLTWQSSDLEPDCTHPSPSGSEKASKQLLNFFITHPLTSNWFLDQSKDNGTLLVFPNPDQSTENSPVSFTSSAQTGSSVYWYFDDGTTFEGNHPVKPFALAGNYNISVLAIAPDGTYKRGHTNVSVVSPQLSPRISPNPTIIHSPMPSPGPVPGDLNADFRVDYSDLLDFLNFFRTQRINADFNNNSRVDIFDFTVLSKNYGRSSGSYFTVSVADESFCFYTTDEQTIQAARDNYFGRNSRILSGRVIPNSGGFNYGYGGLPGDKYWRYWNWHMDPAQTRMVDSARELCDGMPYAVEYGPIDIGEYCPWLSKVTALDCPMSGVK